MSAQLISLLLFLCAARVMGPSDFGRTMAAVGVASFVGMVFDFGAAVRWTRDLTRASSLSVYLRELRTRLGVAAATLSSLYLVLISPLSNDAFLVLCPALGISAALAQLAWSPSRAKGTNGGVAMGQIADKVVGATAFAVTAFHDWISLPEALLASLCLGAITSAIVGMIVALGSWGLPARTTGDRSLTWSPSNGFGRSSVAVGAQSLDVQVIAITGGPVAAGLYAAVSRLGNPIGLAANLVSQAALPMMSVLSPAAALKVLKSTIWILTIPMLGIIVLISSAPIVVDTLLGGDYSGSIEAVRVLGVGLLAAILNQPLATFLNSQGRERRVGNILTIGVGIHLVLAGALSIAWGAVGAAAAVALSQWLMLARLTSTSRKLLEG